MSEYPPERFKRREWASRFTGSAGTVVVTQDAALLWTDGRYFLQAEQELGPGWTLMRAGTGLCPEVRRWSSLLLLSLLLLAACVRLGKRQPLNPARSSPLSARPHNSNSEFKPS